MKTLRLRSHGDAMGTTVDVEVHFAPAAEQKLLDRLIQVAAIIRDDCAAARAEQDLPCAAARLVTRIECDPALNHVTVSACCPEWMTAEQLQRSLLALVPPA